MVWEYIIMAVVGILLAVTMQPKPQQGAAPPGLGDVQAPTAEDGREIPVLFGTREIKGPNVVYYGDFEAEPVQKKAG